MSPDIHTISISKMHASVSPSLGKDVVQVLPCSQHTCTLSHECCTFEYIYLPVLNTLYCFAWWFSVFILYRTTANYTHLLVLTPFTRYFLTYTSFTRYFLTYTSFTRYFLLYTSFTPYFITYTSITRYFLS